MEQLRSAQGADRATRGKSSLADFAVIGKSVVRVFLKGVRYAINHVAASHKSRPEGNGAQ
jgi:hypothetical protein